MSSQTEDITLRIVNGLATVDREQWNAIANPIGEPFDPFVTWEFLEALEATGCVSPETGWSPHHVIAVDGSDTMIGAMPMYLKSHSRGEYIFDYAWADAYENAGGAYYPKLLVAIPFTPVTGRRRLVAPGPNQGAIQDALISAATKIAADNHISSVHMNFVDALEYEKLGALGLLQRQDQQFHWINNNYASWDDFLGALSSAKRKNLRKERKTAQTGLIYRHFTGKDITEDHWDIFYDFYQDTGARKWGSPYLNREFFSLLSKRLADKILLVFAYDEESNQPIAGAMNMVGSETLYGRYWGRSEERPCLHFETCYYQAIDYAIAHGLKRVEAGAQGGHKLARGYSPTATYSCHWLANESFSDAVAAYLERERDHVAADMEYLGQRTPFRKGEEHQ